jgi:hypothetical protein
MSKNARVFAMVVAFVLTAYFALAAALLGDASTSSEDDAVVKMVTVLMGASGVVGLCMLFSFLSVTGPDDA